MQNIKKCKVAKIEENAKIAEMLKIHISKKHSLQRLQNFIDWKNANFEKSSNNDNISKTAKNAKIKEFKIAERV